MVWICVYCACTPIYFHSVCHFFYIQKKPFKSFSDPYFKSNTFIHIHMSIQKVFIKSIKRPAYLYSLLSEYLLFFGCMCVLCALVIVHIIIFRCFKANCVDVLFVNSNVFHMMYIAQI